LAPHEVVASRAIDLARQIKSEAEIALLRQSQKLNEAVLTAVLPKIRPGMSERAAQGMILAEIAGREELDGYSFAPIVAAGSNAWEIHHLPDSTLLEKGDMVIIDLGVVFQGYASDMTRTICLGKPTARMREIYKCVALAQERAFNLVKPGVTNHELDTVTREVISQAGHGRGYTHGLGHSIGLETHDPGPNLSQRAAEVPLKAGMTLTIEPGIYLEGEFGVRLEDTIVVRPGGHENLTNQSLELFSLDL
jgi:Xaa-Pro aminopeptidase